MGVACHPVPEPATPRRVVVMGPDAGSVGAEVRRRRDAGERVAGFVGGDEALARAMAEEMLGPIYDVVVLPAP